MNGGYRLAFVLISDKLVILEMICGYKYMYFVF